MILNGKNIEVARIAAADTSASTLIFLHEGLGSLALWRDFPERLARRSGLGGLIYSRIGNGFSEIVRTARLPSYMHDEAATLSQLLDAQAVERVVLVGHSDGASIALLFAAAYPERVAAVVALAPHVFVEEISLRSIADIKERYACGELRERMAAYHADVDATFYGWNDIWLHPEFRAWNIEAEVERIVAPVLCIQGSDDEYGTLAQIDAIAKRATGPVDRLMLAQCGHAPQRDRPEFVVESIGAWLSETLAS